MSQTAVGENILVPTYLFILILTDMPVNITEGLLSLVYLMLFLQVC